jgi:hypothetical protein
VREGKGLLAAAAGGAAEVKNARCVSVRGPGSARRVRVVGFRVMESESRDPAPCSSQGYGAAAKSEEGAPCQPSQTNVRRVRVMDSAPRPSHGVCAISEWVRRTLWPPYYQHRQQQHPDTVRAFYDSDTPCALETRTQRALL